MVEAQYNQEGVQIGFNAEYLLDFLGAITASNSVRVKLKDSESAAEFCPSGNENQQYRYVLMPVRS